MHFMHFPHPDNPNVKNARNAFYAFYASCAFYAFCAFREWYRKMLKCGARIHGLITNQDISMTTIKAGGLMGLAHTWAMHVGQGFRGGPWAIKCCSVPLTAMVHIVRILRNAATGRVLWGGTQPTKQLWFECLPSMRQFLGGFIVGPPLTRGVRR